MKLVSFTCDRCAAEEVAAEIPFGWLAVEDQDFCEGCVTPADAGRESELLFEEWLGRIDRPPEPQP